MSFLTDAVLGFLYDLAVIALYILPESPFSKLEFQSALSSYSTYMSWINYFVPIGTFLNITTFYLTAVLIWYAVRWLLRLVQYID